MSDKDLVEELLSARNLALWACRNDEGIIHDDQYRLFHKRLIALKIEFEKRGLGRHMD